MIKRTVTVGMLAATAFILAPREAKAVQCVNTAQPGQVPAAKLVYISEDASVTSTFCDGSAGYTSDAYLVHPSMQYLGTGHLTAYGATVDLGFFTEGTELVFAIYVRNTGHTYYTGPGSRNPDGMVHAAVTDMGGGDYHVGFEDLFYGGDMDYDDINLVISSESLAVVPPTATDTDGDGVPDYSDNCLFVANSSQADGDGDGIGDACDCVDDDGDGICGSEDNCPGLANPDQADADGDGFGDGCDVCPQDAQNDGDGDGVCGDLDNCPAAANADQADNDGDGSGDACDADDDDDGVADASDNCPLTENAEQSDFDADGFGDACDTDDDSDGVLDGADQCPATPEGEIVLSNGCSIVDLAPCAGSWKNHGSYVKAVVDATKLLIAEGLLTQEEAGQIIAAAAQSECGK
jgi:hypothetical protein